MGIDDSTYQYTIKQLEINAINNIPFKDHRAFLIDRFISKLQEIILATDSNIFKLKYRLMGYHQLVGEVNEVLKVNDIKPISASTLKRIMQEYNIQTLWMRNHKKRSKSGTKLGKPDNRYIVPNRRSTLLHEDTDEWNHNKVIHTGNLKYKFQLISSDIKQYNYNGGKIYETIQIDELEGTVVGYHHSSSLIADETSVASIENMLEQNPDVDFTDTMFHSDQGSQYSSKAYSEVIASIGGISSMSPAGSPNHNPRAENFFSLSSKNTNDLLKNIDNFEEAVELLVNNILIHNNSKIKPHLGYKTSYQFAQQAKHFRGINDENRDVYTKVLLTPFNKTVHPS